MYRIFFCLYFLALNSFASVSLLDNYRNEFKVPISKELFLSGRWMIEGFSLTAENTSVAQDCTRFTKIKFLILAAIRIRNLGMVPEDLVKCAALEDLVLLRDLISLHKNKKNLDSKTLSEFQHKDQITEILKIKKEKRAENSSYLKKLNFWKEYYNAAKLDFTLEKKFYSLVNSTADPFLKSLLKMVKAVKKENLSIVKSEAKLLFDKPFFDRMFSSPLQSISDLDLREKTKKNITQMLVIIFNSIQDPNLKTFFHLYLDEFYPELVKEEPNLELRFSIERFNKLIYNPYWGLDHPVTIIPIIHRRSKVSEVNNYIFQLKNSKISKYSTAKFTFLSYYNFLQDKDIRTKVGESISKMYFDGTAAEKFLAIELLGQTSIRRELKTSHKEFLRPIFILKRKFFLDILAKNIAVDFAIFNLINLGDIRLNYLWWIIL